MIRKTTVITDCNIDKKFKGNNRNSRKIGICFNILLTSGKHLNNYDADMLDGVKINYSEFR